MKHGFGGLLYIPALAVIVLAGMPTSASAQRFTDPDILAPVLSHVPNR